MDFIKEIEKFKNHIKKKINAYAVGDVKRSLSSVNKLKKWIGYSPKFNTKIGIRNFVNWYLKYYKIKL